MPALRSLALLPLLFVAFSGCASEAPTANVVPTSGAPAPGNLTLAPPAWKVGQWWEHQWTLYDGGEPSFSFLMRNVVAEDLGGGWTVATENRTVAAFHGAFIFPTLGRFSAGPEMTATVGEMRFPWYRFPLAANQTWSDSVTTLDFSGEKVTYPIEVRVTAIGAQGAQLEARTGGKLSARYDFDAKTGWIGDAQFFNDEEQLAFRVQRLAAGAGHTGTVYDATGALLASTFSAVSPFFLAPAPAMRFEVPAGQTHLLAFLYAFAEEGVSESALVAPDGTHYEAVSAKANGIPLNDSSQIVLAPAVEGSWTFESAGAGMIAGGGLDAWGIQERAIQL